MAFTREQSVQGAHKANEAKRRNKNARMELSAVIYDVVKHVPASDLPDYFVDASTALVGLVREGRLPDIESTADLLRVVEAADKLHKMGRLAGGQSTSNSANLTANPDQLADLLDKVARLRGTTTADVDASSQDLAADEPDRQLPPAQ